MAEISEYSRVTPAIERLAQVCLANSQINRDDYIRYNVKRGLRDLDGTGVLAGLTEISEIISSKTVNGEQHPCPGELYYRGYSIQQLTDGFLRDGRFGFEETAYLLMFGQLPDAAQLEQFNRQLAFYRSLPTNFVRDVILKAPSADMMNTLARCVLTMASYDERPDDISLPNVIRQCIDMIAIFPLIAVYGYQAYNYYLNGKSLYIHTPRPELSTAENILTLLRPDGQYTPLEARILDLCLVLHAEHGGGNNSTFTTHVVTSSGTDTYSSVAASLGSLKGPKHGGANVKVCDMFDNIKEHVPDFDRGKLQDYVGKILDKEAYDHTGLVYGMGHAVYSLSDPRADILRTFAEKLAAEKHKEEEYEMRKYVAQAAAELIAEKRRIYKGVAPNVDFYSGFVYDMLGLPRELYTPFFAVSRISGWSAHRMEEITNGGKIIRPGYQAVAKRKKYVPIEQRREEE